MPNEGARAKNKKTIEKIKKAKIFKLLWQRVVRAVMPHEGARAKRKKH